MDALPASVDGQSFSLVELAVGLSDGGEAGIEGVQEQLASYSDLPELPEGIDYLIRESERSARVTGNRESSRPEKAAGLGHEPRR
jgi:hypothetical protein